MWNAQCNDDWVSAYHLEAEGGKGKERSRKTGDDEYMRNDMRNNDNFIYSYIKFISGQVADRSPSIICTYLLKVNEGCATLVDTRLPPFLCTGRYLHGW